MGQGQPQGFGDDLCGGGGSQELAAAAGSGAGAAAHFGGCLQGDLLLGVAGADGLYFACIFA